MKKKFLIKDLEEMEKFANLFLGTLQKREQNFAEIIKLSGDLGSGKTTFVQKIGKILKIKEKISSPTFVISKIYKIPKNSFVKKKFLIHVDAYRLGEKQSMKNIGLDEQIKNSENLIFIE
jgi:tRNA threonylcarbamoyl adenosine modification protein YjeE